MDEDEALPATRIERLAVADLLDGLGPGEWERASLCAGWTVHDVAAHLTWVTRLSLRSAVVGLVRARGDLDRLIAGSAGERAARYAPEELVGQLRETAASPRRPPGTTVWDPLVDVLVHGQDVARPLGRELVMPQRPVLGALTHVWSTSAYGTPKRFAGLRFRATDADWSAGRGDHEVSGPAGDLLLLSTGRAAALGAVQGSGKGEARRRLDA